MHDQGLGKMLAPLLVSTRVSERVLGMLGLFMQAVGTWILKHAGVLPASRAGCISMLKLNMQAFSCPGQLQYLLATPGHI